LRDDVIIVGVDAGQAQCKIVRLAARIDKETHAQWIWQQGCQLSGTQYQVVVQEAVVCVE
jgi:hypothetical protein